MEMDRRERELRERREQQRRTAKSRAAKKKKKQKKAKKGVLVFMLCLLVIGGLLVSAYTFLFPIKGVSVVGNSKYTAQEIMDASGIKTGENLLALDSKEIEKAIRLSCPYVQNVSLEKKLPGNAVLHVVEGAATLTFLINNEYYMVNNAYELMEVVAEPTSGALVHGVAVTSTGVGNAVSFENSQAKQVLDELVNCIEEHGIAGIQQIDLRDLNNIRLLFEDRLVWELGNTEELSYKLKFGLEISNREKGTGTVKLSGLNKGKNGYFVPGVLQEFIPTVAETPTDVSTEK